MWFIVFLMMIMTPNAYAANPYHLGEIDYFDHKDASQGEKEGSFDFREPIVGAAGTVTYYTPPSVVLSLLESPTPENARAYLAWQRQKVAKIVKAQEVIDQVIKEEPKK